MSLEIKRAHTLLKLPKRYMRPVPQCMLAYKLSNPIGRCHECASDVLRGLSHAYVLVEPHALAPLSLQLSCPLRQ
eukprot:1136442-Pelagomonas_calceolata.AAC.1